MSSSPSFWTALAAYASELASVAGPLLGAVSDTASAIERAGTQTRAINAQADALERDLLLLAPTSASRPSRKAPAKRRSTTKKQPASAAG